MRLPFLYPGRKRPANLAKLDRALHCKEFAVRSRHAQEDPSGFCSTDHAESVPVEIGYL